MDKLKGLSSAVLTSDVGQEMQRWSEDLIAAMDAYEAARMQEWCGLATVVSEQKLCQPVLRCAQPCCWCLGSSCRLPAVQ